MELCVQKRHRLKGPDEEFAVVNRRPRPVRRASGPVSVGVRFLLRDTLYSIRRLRRSPAFTALATAILALGIGAATAIFSLIYGVALNTLPFRDADHLMAIWSDFSKSAGNRRGWTISAAPKPRSGESYPCHR